jgi:hypothetical protein
MSHIRKFDEFLKESEKIEDKKITDVWKEVYGKDLVIDHPTIFKILKHRPSVDKMELKRMWEETYEEDLEKEHPEFYSKIS